MSQKKILVADDEPDIVQALKNFLEDHGYQVFTASNGIEALEISRREKPHLIILDVMMPQMSGLQFVEALRSARAEIGFVPVIVISARASMGDFFSPSDITHFFAKPFKMEDLLKTITETLGGPDSKEALKKKEAPKTDAAPSFKSDYHPEKESDFGGFPEDAKAWNASARATVIVLGVEETLVSKLKKYLESLKCDVRDAMDEADALAKIKENPPALVLCQYWGDSEILDAGEVQSSLRASYPSIFVAIFCEQRWVKAASEQFKTEQILPYQTAADLYKTLSTFIGKRFKK
jgi:CheY-like chemotaxis protein